MNDNLKKAREALIRAHASGDQAEKLAWLDIAEQYRSLAQRFAEAEPKPELRKA